MLRFVYISVFFSTLIQAQPAPSPYHTPKPWPQGTVHYDLSSSFPLVVQTTILDAMREVQEDTNVHGRSCIQFVRRTTENSYLQIVPGSISCVSDIGYDVGVRTMRLAPGCYSKGTVMHELLHVLGFFHEHQRPDRDDYIQVHYSNILQGHTFDYMKLTASIMSTFGLPYDFGSILHYRPSAFAADLTLPAYSLKRPTVDSVGQRLGLSSADVKKVQLYYQCGTDVTHIAHAHQPNELLHCNFESPSCPNLHQNNGDKADQFDWIRHTGPSGTPYTGPNGDFASGGGLYYLIAKAAGHHNQKAVITTDDIPSTTSCLSFLYYVYGPGVKKLTISVIISFMTTPQPIKIFTGSQGNEWKKLTYTMRTPPHWKLSFEADIGDTDEGDIAIDDIVVYDGECQH